MVGWLGETAPPRRATMSDSPTPPRQARSNALTAPPRARPWDRAGLLALVVVAVSLFAPLACAGLADPFELGAADLARRLAVNVFAANGLRHGGLADAMIDLGDLRSGELPFTSMALGFSLFGWHEWAGRLPLAVWGGLGVAAMWLLVSRLEDRVAGAWTALLLATTPLYFVQARTMLGDGVTMATVAIATAGLALALLDQGRWRLLGGGLAVGGLVLAYLCRGPLYGVWVPTAGVGLAWLVCRTSGGPGWGRGGSWAGGVVLLGALAALVAGLAALAVATRDPGRFRLLLGVPLVVATPRPTFEAVFRQIAHGLFPYSALLPFAAGRLLKGPAGSTRPSQSTALRVVLLSVLGVALATHAALGARTSPVPFVGVGAVAATIAIALRDIDRGGGPSWALALGAVAVCVVLVVDHREEPGRTLAAFGFALQRFPDAARDTLRLWQVVALGFAGVALLALLERPLLGAPVFRREDYWAWPQALWRADQGGILSAALIVEAALLGIALLGWLGGGRMGGHGLAPLSTPLRLLASVGWIVFPVLLVGLPCLGLLIRDLSRTAFRLLPLSRAGTVVGAGVATGLVASLVYYPSLARQLSPREALATYQQRRRGDEGLGLLGVGVGGPRHYVGEDAEWFSSAQPAFDWLTSKSSRRWMLVRGAELPDLNSLYRTTSPGHNLPVLDARSSEILLISNRLEPGESNANPLSDLLPEWTPAPAHRLNAVLDDKLAAIGWDVTTRSGTPVAGLVPGRTYEFRIFWRVTGRITGEWDTFLHIDGSGRRHNGDHETLGGRYPPRLWQVGDVLCDTHPFTLEPNFTPGLYGVYFGLFAGSRRLPVTQGEHDSDRIVAGKVVVH